MFIFGIVIIIALLIDMLLPYLLAIPYKGFQHKRQVMSVIGAKSSPLRAVYNIWIIISGVVCIVLGYYVFYVYNNGLAIAIWVLVGLYGLGDEILSGIFPLSSERKDNSISTKIHGVSSALGLIAMQFAPLLLGISQLRNQETVPAIISFLCFALSLICFCFFIMGDKPYFKKTIFAWEGLWQRIIMYLQYIPFILFVAITII